MSNLCLTITPIEPSINCHKQRFKTNILQFIEGLFVGRISVSLGILREKTLLAITIKAVNVKCKCNLFTHGEPRSSQELVQKCPCIPKSNWNLELLVFKERGKPEYPEKILSEQSREPTPGPGSTDPGHIGGRPALSPLRQPCSLLVIKRTPDRGLKR